MLTFDVKNSTYFTFYVGHSTRQRISLLRPSLMGSELRCQNFDLVKFREIIPRNPFNGTFFSQNFQSDFSKNSDPPAEPKLESELWPNSDSSSGLDNFVRTSPRGSCAAF